MENKIVGIIVTSIIVALLILIIIMSLPVNNLDKDNEFLVYFVFNGTESEVNLTYQLDNENTTYPITAPRDPTGHLANVTTHILIEGEHNITIKTNDLTNVTMIQFNLTKDKSSLIISIDSQNMITSRYYDYLAWGD